MNVKKSKILVIILLTIGLVLYFVVKSYVFSTYGIIIDKSHNYIDVKPEGSKDPVMRIYENKIDKVIKNGKLIMFNDIENRDKIQIKYKVKFQRNILNANSNGEINKIIIIN